MKGSSQKSAVEILFLLGLPILVGSFLDLQTSNLVIFPFAALIILRIGQLYIAGHIRIKTDFQTSKKPAKGFAIYAVFTICALTVIYCFKGFINLPEWLTNSEPWAFLLLHAFLQELIYRAYLINRLKLISKNPFSIALIGAIVFAGVHLLLPFSLQVILLTLISGFAWSLIYQKYPSLLFATLSHFALNLVLITWF